MQAPAKFHGVLESLGGFDYQLIAEDKNWDLVSVKYRTPAGNLPAIYLCLASDCPLTEASKSNLTTWGRAGAYTVFVTTKSRLANDLERTAKIFGGKTATTPRSLLFENVMSSLAPRAEKVEEFKYFIPPEIELPKGEKLPKGEIRPALSYLADALGSIQSISSARACAEILVAPAGLGKTTLCRAIARKLLDSETHTIPILVESAQWQNLINLTLPNVLNAALLALIPEAGRLTNAKLFQLLVREQLLVPIFDGFDELCLHPNSNYSPAGLLTELIELVGDAGARMLITVRETFWDKYGTGVPADRIERVNLQGFSNDQRQRFFIKRLSNPAERNIANRVAKEIGTRLYEGDVQQDPLQKDRASGIPLMLELVALYVEGNPEATFAPASHDPLGPLLSSVCDRENLRQKLQITAEQQMSIFEELFRDHPGDIQRDDLKLYIEDTVPDVTADTVVRFESHAFFSPGQDVRPRFEILRVYFIARWLANRLEAAVAADIDKQTMQVLERSATGSSDVFDHLVSRFMAMEPRKARAAISHAFKMIRARQSWEGACSALFHLAQRLAHQKQSIKCDRTSSILEYLGIASSPPCEFSGVAIFGQVTGLDLTGIVFKSCVFKDLEFQNCTFSETTEFQKARFEGELKFENCERPGTAVLADCIFSAVADVAWAVQQGRAVKRVVSDETAIEAMREVLRRFVAPFGFTSIKETDRNSGSILKNLCRDTAWDELISAGIIHRHRISGVTGGGLNIDEAQALRHEVRNFLDNAVVGPTLRKVKEKILRKN